jgi:hypothetical protein
VYEYGASHSARTNDSSRALAEARAVTRAAMLCELSPSVPRGSKG